MKEKLSTTTSITSTYAGQFAGEYISAMFLKAKTLADNLITIKPNIKYEEVVKKGVIADVIGAATCDFTATGSVTLTERILKPVELQVNMQLCKKDFRSDWEAVEMGLSVYDNLPPKMSDWLIDQVSKSVAGSIETMIWQGTGGTGAFTGFTALLKADSTVNDVSGTTITASNVQAELAKVVAKCATLNVWNGDVKPVIYAATDVVFNYLISLGGFGASGLGANGFKGEGPTGVQNAPLFYAGLQIVEVPGMATSEMVVAQPSNLWFGTGLMSDYNEVKVIDTGDTLGDQNVRIVMRFTGAVQYGIGSEICYYWIY